MPSLAGKIALITEGAAIDINPANRPSAEFLKGYMAIKRFGHTDEIAVLAAFLAGPEGAFITGTGIKIDGGFDA